MPRRADAAASGRRAPRGDDAASARTASAGDDAASARTAPRGDDAASVLAALERRATKATRDGMARYGIVAPQAFGVTMADMQKIAKPLGTNHALAQALWETGWYEARIVACFVADAQRMTAAEMDRWCRDFDNWAIVDTACFHLFDRSPRAWRKVEQWSRRRAEYERRAAFALLASLALHDRQTADASFRPYLRLIEQAAADERNFVKKAVSWALRSVGARSRRLNADAIAVAERLAASDDRTERWVGKDALRKLKAPATAKRLEKRGG